MNLPIKLDINEFDYNLTEEKIARYPLPDRDNSKLLFYQKRNITTHLFKELPQLIEKDYKMIFNDTRVILARLKFKKESGSEIEILLLEPYDPVEYSQSFSSYKMCSWICLIGNAKKWKNENLVKNIEFKRRAVCFEAIKGKKTGNAYLVTFKWNNDNLSFSEIISQAGQVPLPPYLNREAEPCDKDRYQTIYSFYEGSVAAPTAGLHFTKKVIENLDKKGIKKYHLTLHIGAGTFIPVKTDNALLHEMHSERIFIDRQTIENLYLSNDKNIAVGTTSVRALESLYYIGLKIDQKMPEKEMLFLDQWEPYVLKKDLGRKQALNNVLKYLDNNKLKEIRITTKIMIIPSYKFKMTDGLITNFHQPKSTLLLLVAAFVGKDWKRIYDYGLENRYRFLSYGDSSLIIR